MSRIFKQTIIVWVLVALDVELDWGLAMDELNYCTHCWEVDVSVDDGLCSECYKAAEEARLELEKHENDACEECTRRMESGNAPTVV